MLRFLNSIRRLHFSKTWVLRYAPSAGAGCPPAARIRARSAGAHGGDAIGLERLNSRGTL